MLWAGFVQFRSGVRVNECEAAGCNDESVVETRLCRFEFDPDFKAFFLDQLIYLSVCTGELIMKSQDLSLS